MSHGIPLLMPRSMNSAEVQASRLAASDLAQLTNVQETPLFICMIPTCYRLFPDRQRLSTHRSKDHAKTAEQSEGANLWASNEAFSWDSIRALDLLTKEVVLAPESKAEQPSEVQTISVQNQEEFVIDLSDEEDVKAVADSDDKYMKPEQDQISLEGISDPIQVDSTDLELEDPPEPNNSQAEAASLPALDVISSQPPLETISPDSNTLLTKEEQGQDNEAKAKEDIIRFKAKEFDAIPGLSFL